jgi:hypothetical protein
MADCTLRARITAATLIQGARTDICSHWHCRRCPLTASVFFIKKKDGKLHFVQDYQALNAITRKNWYLLPLINNLIHRLKDAHYFTKLDVHWGYNNVCIHEDNEWKAAFHTNRGLFEPLVMYFSLTNSMATFQTMMNEIFQDLITEGVIFVYLDDNLIFTNTFEEHHHITCLVLDCMHEHKLYLQLEKRRPGSSALASSSHITRWKWIQ